ncbi:MULTISPECIES: CCA tRNA nucleotidyltransferase [Bacillus]|uniref:CCA-adding enzyme n=2 Tax=Bacillus cereus group TaxID=86661 RepID=A0A2A7DGB4_BACAN|nr:MULTISPECIES: CCA tRNA nucleotidyltransferase [Bacillus]MCP1162893.1 CCA tRNA nucleotidyltransferase [Bacillus sp. 1813sda1]MDC7974148.1 CCA tRNA nucleotidyltransferase [Bacillus sp. BLCC-B18]OTW68151.1 CCA tRNA nucleotidyltransferase [Bacillus thuringiensis serovar coreanensis]OTX44768.1 CCA tRNA nucleotidyltransferase [Bacillus thuringiensis serovar sooncheon]OTX53932.1 CCA tRNA nucleotidyltransferase [Bacillus thuringiensis serovar guiyangiensis]
MERFKKASSIIETLKQQGHEAYFVGGSVRDLIIDRPIGDIDIATSALPEEVMAIFPRHVPVGLEHGTVIVVENGEPYEVTTFRTESEYEDFRRPSSVQFVRSLEEDLKRRDFTMNAIAMTEEGEMVDLFAGQEAIQKREIVTVGNAADRFQEDALRMMRGIRFVSTLGFSLEMKTKQAIETYGHLLEHIAIERITVEFEKLLTGTYCVKGLQQLVETKLFSHLPYLQMSEERLLQATQYKWDSFETDIEAWAFFLYCIGEEHPSVFLRQWKFSNKKIKDIVAVLLTIRTRKEKDWDTVLLYKTGIHIAEMAERVYEAMIESYDNTSVKRVQTLFEALPIKSRQEMNVTGNDLLNWANKKPGPWVAEMIQNIEEAIVQGNVVNEKECIREWLQECNLL